MGDIYDSAPPGYFERGPTREEAMQNDIKELKERVTRLENKEKRLGPSPDSPSPYDLGAIHRAVRGKRR